ncbi:MAG: hypothetical protein ACKOBZ_03320 [Nitrospira sp.]|nr:hypothetical protein [Nitrospira sp.]
MRAGMIGFLAVCGGVLAAAPGWAIDVKLTMEEAKKSLEAGRAPMEKAADSAKPDEEIKKLMQQASMVTRIGADPEKDACGTSAVLRTKRFWLESWGRKEATESRKQNQQIRMPADKIQKYLDMPNLEIEVQLCGEDEYFAEGVQVAFQQGSKTVKPVDVSPADRGRKIDIADRGVAFRTRFTARFAYDTFDPNGKTKVVVFFMDGKQIEFDADFSNVK